MHQNHLDCLLAGPHLQNFWFNRSGVGLGACISNKFPAGTDPAGPGTTPGEQRPHSTSWHCSSCWNATSQPHSHRGHYSVSGHCLMLRLLSSFLQVCLSYLVRPRTGLHVLMFLCWVLICIFHWFMEVHRLPFNFPSTPVSGSLWKSP